MFFLVPPLLDDDSSGDAEDVAIGRARRRDHTTRTEISLVLLGILAVSRDAT
jgi:hypothetical protein